MRHGGEAGVSREGRGKGKKREEKEGEEGEGQEEEREKHTGLTTGEHADGALGGLVWSDRKGRRGSRATLAGVDGSATLPRAGLSRIGWFVGEKDRLERLFLGSSQSVVSGSCLLLDTAGQTQSGRVKRKLQEENLEYYADYVNYACYSRAEQRAGDRHTTEPDCFENSYISSIL